MKRIKPIHISILTIVVFVVALLIGMQTGWWQTSGRRTPLDEERGNGHGGGKNAEEQQGEHDDLAVNKIPDELIIKDMKDFG